MSTKSVQVSFNQWLKLQKEGPFAEFAKAWTITRGRLTSVSVEERAVKAGLPGVGTQAYAAYLAAVA